MWNFQVAGLLVGATIVCYDGSPTYPRPDALWDIAGRAGAYRAGHQPRLRAGLREGGRRSRAPSTTCRRCAPSASPARRCRRRRRCGCVTTSASGFRSPRSAAAPMWCRAFIGGVPHRAGVAGGVVGAVPRCRAGRVGRVRQAGARRGRGAGHHQADAVDAASRSGTTPTASRYRDAYFDMFPGVWRHGDWITHHRARQHHRARPLRLDAEPPRRPDGQRRHLPGGREAAGGRRGAGHRRQSNPTAATGCRCSWCSPTARSSTDELANGSRRAIRDRGVPAARARRDHRRPGDSAHPNRQEARGADQEAVPGRRPPRASSRRSAVDDPALLDWYANLKR